jgi:predicted RNA binding protein YcfA (HicA-like mRNA interferase family)
MILQLKLSCGEPGPHRTRYGDDVAKVEKLIAELKACEGPFSYRSMQRLLGYLGYEERAARRGSGRKFINADTKDIITAHEPHPGDEIKPYLVRQIRDHLEERNLI